MTVFSLAKTFLRDAAGKTPCALLSCADLTAGSPHLFLAAQISRFASPGPPSHIFRIDGGSQSSIKDVGFHRSPKNIYNYEMHRMKKTWQVLDAPALQTVICRLPPHGWLNLWLESTSRSRSVTGWPLMCDTIDFHAADSPTRIAPTTATMSIYVACFSFAFFMLYSSIGGGG